MLSWLIQDIGDNSKKGPGVPNTTDGVANLSTSRISSPNDTIIIPWWRCGSIALDKLSTKYQSHQMIFNGLIKGMKVDNGYGTNEQFKSFDLDW